MGKQDDQRVMAECRASRESEAWKKWAGVRIKYADERDRRRRKAAIDTKRFSSISLDAMDGYPSRDRPRSECLQEAKGNGYRFLPFVFTRTASLPLFKQTRGSEAALAIWSGPGNTRRRVNRSQEKGEPKISNALVAAPAVHNHDFFRNRNTSGPGDQTESTLSNRLKLALVGIIPDIIKFFSSSPTKTDREN